MEIYVVGVILGTLLVIVDAICDRKRKVKNDRGADNTINNTESNDNNTESNDK